MRSIPELPRARCRILFFTLLTVVAFAVLPRPAALAAAAGLTVAVLSLVVAANVGRAFALGFVLADWLVLGLVIATGGGIRSWQVLLIAPLALIELRPAPREEWPALIAPALILVPVLLAADPELAGSRLLAFIELAALYAAGALAAAVLSGALTAALDDRRRGRNARSRAARPAAARAGVRRSQTRAGSPAAAAVPAGSAAPVSATTTVAAAPADRPRRAGPRTRPASARRQLDTASGLPDLSHVSAQLSSSMRRSKDWNVPLSLICLRFPGSGDDDRAAAICGRRLCRRLRHDEHAFRVCEDTILVSLLGRDRADAVALAAALEHELPGAVAARAGGAPDIIAGVTAYDGRRSLRELLSDAAQAAQRAEAWEAASR